MGSHLGCPIRAIPCHNLAAISAHGGAGQSGHLAMLAVGFAYHLGTELLGCWPGDAKPVG